MHSRELEVVRGERDGAMAERARVEGRLRVKERENERVRRQWREREEVAEKVQTLYAGKQLTLCLYLT